jgi:hypothetical protein
MEQRKIYLKEFNIYLHRLGYKHKRREQII